MKIVLIICLTSLLAGCSTFSGKDKWPSPVKPISKSVEVIPVPEADIKNDGFYLNREDAHNLADNVEELKAYVEKLEAQIKKMKKYYGGK